MASLESLWKEGRDGALSPLEQMRAWALRTAQSDLGGDKALNYEKIAERVTKVGGGIPPVRRSAGSSTGWTRTRSGIRERTTGAARADERGRTCAGGAARRPCTDERAERR